MTTLRTDCSWFPRSISLYLLISLLANFSTNTNAHPSETLRRTPSAQSIQVQVPILQQFDSRGAGFGRCGYSSKTVGPVVEEDEFRKLVAPKITSKATPVSDRCAFLKRLEVDFNQHTLLTYGVNGDCFVRAKARVIRNDSNKSYVLRITKIYGGCRAAGSFEGWLVIEKVPPDYKIAVELFERDESGVTRRSVNR